MALMLNWSKYQVGNKMALGVGNKVAPALGNKVALIALKVGNYRGP